MIEGLNIDPFNSDRMMYGTGATLFATNNLTTWDSGGQVAIKSTALGIEEMAVTELVSPPSGAHLFSGVLDVEGFRHDDLTKSPVTMYTPPRWGAASTIDYAELKPSFIVRVGNDSGTVISSSFSSDSGTTWIPASVNPSGYTGNGTSMIAVAADASRVVWSAPGAGVCYSTNNGSSWSSSSGIPQGTLFLSDRMNPKKFYGFLNSIFYVSTDGGVTFTATNATGLPSASSTSTRLVKAMPGHEGDIWLASGSSGSTLPPGLWHSTNSGATFTKLANVTQAYTIGFGKAAPGHHYMALYITGIIGSTAGIFRSDNAGETWLRVNDDQHQYGSINSAITGDPRIYGRVYVGTNGMGIVYGDIVDDGRDIS
jgi:xyloglucan-specific exo-beta-1,4-glucanase